MQEAIHYGVSKAAYMKAAQSQYSVPRRPASKAAKEEDTNFQEQVDGTYDMLSLSNTAKGKLRSQSDGYLFANQNELDQYLGENFPAYKSGMVSISKKYLKDCLTDPDKLSTLEDTLDAIPGMLDEIKSNLSKDTKLLSCTFSIDDDGNLSVETFSSSVTFNAAKRAEEKFQRLKEKEQEEGKPQANQIDLPAKNTSGAILTPSPAEDIAFSTSLYLRS